MKIISIILIFISFYVNAQRHQQQLSFLYKDSGILRYYAGNKVTEVRENMSLKNGTLVKPEGIIILLSGKEVVLKNGEILELGGHVSKVNDSLVRQLHINQLDREISFLKEELKVVRKNPDNKNNFEKLGTKFTYISRTMEGFPQSYKNDSKAFRRADRKLEKMVNKWRHIYKNKF